MSACVCLLFVPQNSVVPCNRSLVLSQQVCCISLYVSQCGPYRPWPLCAAVSGVNTPAVPGSGGASLPLSRNALAPPELERTQIMKTV